MRTAESYTVRAGDVQFHPSRASAILSLPVTKSGVRFNMKECVTLTDAGLIARMYEALSGKEPGDVLFPKGAREFRLLFGKCVEKLGSPRNLRYMPSSICPGAGTADFRMHGLLSRTTLRGRWKHEKTCRIYINEAL